MPPEPAPDLPEPVEHALAVARKRADHVTRLEDELEEYRHAWYAAVADAVDAARDAGIGTAQAVVARALGVSRQRVSELSRRTPAAH